MSAIFANPIAWAQFRLKGGWKNAAITGGAYTLIVAAAIIVTSRLSDPIAPALRTWSGVLLGFQAIILFLFASNRVSVAIRADIQSGLIESHRLMPTSAFAGVLGYVLGAAAQALMLAAVNFVLGALCVVGSDGQLLGWIGANLVMGVVAVLLWSVSAASATVAKGAYGFVVLFVVILATSRGIVASLLPGTAVLIGPLISELVPRMSLQIGWPHAVALLAQLAIAAVCFAATMRRYVRTDTPLFGVVLGLLLVALWAATSLLGMLHAELFIPRFIRDDIELKATLVGTVLVAFLFALVPLSNGLRVWTRFRHYPRPGDIKVPPLLLVFILFALLAVLPLGLRGDELTDFAWRWAMTAAIAACFLVFMAYLLRWIYLAVPAGLFIAGLCLIITWVGPVFADMAYVISTEGEMEELGPVAAASPIGALIRLWGFDEPRDIAAGLLFQLLLAVLSFILFHNGNRRRSAAQAEEANG